MCLVCVICALQAIFFGLVVRSGRAAWADMMDEATLGVFCSFLENCSLPLMHCGLFEVPFPHVGNIVHHLVLFQGNHFTKLVTWRGYLSLQTLCIFTHTHTYTILLLAYRSLWVRFPWRQNLYKLRAQDFSFGINPVTVCFSVLFHLQPLLLYLPPCSKTQGVSTMLIAIDLIFWT